MGAAAEHRGNDLIRRGVWAEFDHSQSRRDEVRAIEIAEECNLFVRQAMDYLIEPKGLRSLTMQRAKAKRGWLKRHEALCVAHNLWVDTDHRQAYAYHEASVRRARAMYDIFMFSLGGWTIPEHISVPRAAKGA